MECSHGQGGFEPRAGAKGGQAPTSEACPPLLLTILTNIQLNYYFLNQYFMFSSKKYA